jgi:hypothetical protein
LGSGAAFGRRLARNRPPHQSGSGGAFGRRLPQLLVL